MTTPLLMGVRGRVGAAAFFAAVLLLFASSLFAFTDKMSAGLSLSKSTDIRVASWNMSWFPSGKPDFEKPKNERRRAAEAANYLISHPVDVLMAQEVRDLAACALLTNQYAKLLQKKFEKEKKPRKADKRVEIPPQLYVNSVSDFWKAREWKVTQQQAIISRYPTVEAGFEPYYYIGTNTPPRGSTWAILDVGGTYVAFISIHLKSNRVNDGEDPACAPEINRAKRVNGIQQTLNLAAKLLRKRYHGKKVESLFIGGDFNTCIYNSEFKDDPTIQEVLSAEDKFHRHPYQDAHATLSRKNRVTHPGSPWYPDETLDYIFWRGAAQRIGAEVVTEGSFSDHRMIGATFRLISR